MLIEIEDLVKVYDMGATQVRALDGVSMNVERGEYIAFMGPSASGKSTLMNLIGCLDTATSGSYRLNGQAVNELDDNALAHIRNKEIGFVFQTFNLLPRTSALENVDVPLIYAGVSRHDRHQRARATLELVGLSDRSHHQPSELQSIIAFPSTLASFFRDNDLMAQVANIFAPHHLVYGVLYAVIIIFFTYFYTAIVLDPSELADNMKKHGGFIPGIRPGKKTAEYIDRVLSRITLPGAILLALIAVLPDMIIASTGVPFVGVGGTSVLIVVGVALDTLQQIESHLIMRHYEGFVKRGRIRGRTRM